MASAAAKQQKFGSHLSVAGGFENAFHEGVDVGCDCLQIFVKNQRQWTAKPISDEQVAAYKAASKETGIGPVVAHASYLLNLASPEAPNRDKSVKALIDELERCEALGVVGLVLHPGAHMGDGEAKGIKRIAASLNKTHKATKGFVCRVLLESTAGQGTTIGHDVAHLGQIIEGVSEAERIGVCLDTCHLFAAGYDLRDVEAYEAMVQAMDASFGVDRVACIHMNDSKFDLGSRRDRHEHINEGFIGRAGFVNVVNDARLAGVPRILETPKGDDDKGRPNDKVNLGKLRRMVRG
ncbi:MAG: deoxyribonuclease IV [Phycisphaerales bacterium]|nr:deoxyribonuclease IV [Phycisphaerales bacterium]